jgi:hypothetical protein
MIRSPLRTGAAALALLLASAGAARAQDASAFSVRDSAGVRIAESTRPAWPQGQGWTVGDTALLDIPMDRRSAGAFRLPDGRIAVPSRGRLHFYRPASTRPDSVMLEYEDEWIGWMGLGAGDSLMAFTRKSGIYVFDADGRIARRSQAYGLTGNWPDAVGRFPDGTLLAQAGFLMSQADPNPRRDLVRHLFVTASGEALGVFGDIPDLARMGYEQVPFSWRVVVATRGDHVLVGDNRTFEFMVVSRDGAVREMVRRPFTPMAVTAEDVEEWRALGQPRIANPSPATRRALERQRAESRRVPAAEVYPAYESLVADDAGNVWAYEARRPNDPRRHWSVFDPQGRWLGTVRLPDRFWPQQVGPDWILGSQADEDGIVSIRMFPLRRTTGGRTAAEPPPAP